MKVSSTDITLDCGCVSTEYEIEDKGRNLVAKIKHTTVAAECTAGHKPRFGLTSAWTRRAVVPPKKVKQAVTATPPQAAPA